MVKLNSFILCMIKTLHKVSSWIQSYHLDTQEILECNTAESNPMLIIKLHRLRLLQYYQFFKVNQVIYKCIDIFQFIFEKMGCDVVCFRMIRPVNWMISWGFGESQQPVKMLESKMHSKLAPFGF